MLRTAIARFGSLLVQIGATPPPPQPRPNDAVRRRQTDQRLRDRLSARPDGSTSVLAGNIQLLGLDDLKGSAGATWPALAETVLKLAEDTIAAHMGPDDEYQRYQNDTFILVFPTLDPAAAKRKTEALSAAIRARVAHELPDSKVEIEHHLSEIDCAHALDEESSIVDAIAQSLQGIRDEVRSTQQRLRRELLRNALVVYSPVWSPKSRFVLMYRCLLDRATGQTTLDHMREMSSVEDLQTALLDIDSLVLGRATAELHALLEKKGKPTFLVPLHFHTVRAKQSRDSYLKLCKGIPEPYRKFLVFEIHGVPSDVLITRVLELTAYMRPYCAGVVLRSPATHEQLAQIASHGLYGISMDLAESAPSQEQLRTELPGIATAASKLGLVTLAHGVNTLGLAEACYRANIDFLNGEAIAGRLSNPKGVHRWVPHSSRPPSDLNQLGGRRAATA